MRLGATADEGLRPDPAERRQLTVMFCDLVGSSELAGQLDPEELSEVIHRYHLACDEVIRELGGHVAQHLGDGVLVYFGYPHAQEDAPHRAVRAGLRILDGLPALSRSIEKLPEPLKMRIGIHTGLVVIGDAGAEELAIGGAPIVASRVQSVAPPGSVVVSDATRRLLRDEFKFVFMGPRELKGLPSMPLHRVLGEADAPDRNAVSGVGLVGREHELAVLGERWQGAKVGRGQVVLVSGEPGIGKSCLLRAMASRIRSELHMSIDCFCSPYHQNSTLHPLIGSLQRLLGFQRDDAPALRLEKLQMAVSHAESAGPETLPLMASLLSLPIPQELEAAAPTGQLAKQRTLEQLVAWILEAARRQPVLMAFEDLHWADPSTLEMLDLLVEQTAEAPLLLLISTRQVEQAQRWQGQAHVSHLGLERLPGGETTRLIQAVGGGKPLPREIAEEIARKTDGVPLFVEELTRMVLESGCLRQTPEGWEAAGPRPDLAIPATLQDSLMARLDQHPRAKQAAQLAATVGREFSDELIRAVWGSEPADLDEGLGGLEAAGLLHRRGPRSDTHYSFKHALIRDAAYESLLRSTRQRFHAVIGRTLEEGFQEVCASEPEILAQHFTAAGEIERALPYWKRAGERALGRSAYVESVNHFTTALDLLAETPPSPSHSHLELELRSSRGIALVATRGYAAPEVEHDYSRAAHLSRDLGAAPHLFPALYGLWTYHLQCDQRGPTLDLARRLGELADTPEHRYAAAAAQGVTAYWSGGFAESERLLRRATELFRPEHQGLFDRGFGHEAPVLSRIYLPWCLIEEGLFQEARAELDAMPALMEEFSDLYIEATVLVFEMCGRLQCGEVDRGRQIGQRIAALATEQNFFFYLAPATCGLGWAQIQEGAHEEGVAAIRQGLGIFQAVGAVQPRAFWLGRAAEGLLAAGKAREGLEAVEEALACEKRLARFWLAELHRLKGELLCLDGDHAEPAESCFRTALAVAAKQGARTQELRAATSLARLMGRQRRAGEGRDLLAPLWERFTQGRDTPAGEEARSVLSQLD